MTPLLTFGIVVLSSLPSVQSVSQDKCYFPSGQPATGLTPRKLNPADQGHFACCFPNEVGLSNGLCYGGLFGIVYRGGCTDATWKDPACPQICLKTAPDSHVHMIFCPGKPFSCDWSTCNNAIEYYNWTRAQVIGVQSATLSTASATDTIAAIATSGTPLDECSNCPGKGAPPKTMGLGVGLGMGLPLLAATACLTILWQLERRKRIRGGGPAATGTRNNVGTGRWGAHHVVQTPVQELGGHQTLLEMDDNHRK
ncbi:MAG: hypothetical protein M1830_002060 [Pleopsidium flavum]|nr:MAG: hypothetical protein M1830_002060 [Pleopsidium flavum]